MPSKLLHWVLVAALALLASPALGKSPGHLTPETFDSEVATGHWFIEHYSPYCGHCTAFAPTWEKLVKEAETEIPNVNLAQINCVLHGDLCNKNNIAGYPSMLMFEDGKIVDKYKGNRKIEDLKKFILSHVHVEHDDEEDHEEDHHEDHTPPPAAPVTKTPINVAGEVEALTASTFESTLLRGPTFVKFYAPWCGHCMKLAPIWQQLAKTLQGNVQVAEVNCDNESSLCGAQSIKGYPTLVYFHNAARSEYSGGRKFEQLKAFAEKAASPSVELLAKESELEQHVKDEQVVYLLIYTSSDREILKIVREDSAVLLGSPHIYAMSSAAIRSKYNVPAGIPWALVALKDGDSKVPTASLYGTPTSTREHLKQWLVANRLPGVLELTQDTFQTVMNAPQSPLVVIAASNDKLQGKIREKMGELAKIWKVKTGGSGRVGGREVVFTWMDAKRWKEWMKSMYGIQVDEDDDDLEDVKVIVANHKDLVYYDQDLSGRSFKLTARDRIFKSLEDIVSGTLGYKNSENLIERFARSLNAKMVSLEQYIVEYPYRFTFFLIVTLGVVFWGLYRWIGDDASKLERGDHVHFKSKTGRID